MTDIISLFEAHGLLSVFAGVLVEQLGAPFPAMPFLLLAGARSATDTGFALNALFAAASACVLADSLWFLAGRRYGRSVLAVLCRLSLSPATCVQKSQASFARRGRVTLLFAKFIPGLSTLASPLAGALRMPLLTFILLDLAGTMLWAGSGLAAGLVFHAEVNALMHAMSSWGRTAALLVVVALAVYASWRALRHWHMRSKLQIAAGGAAARRESAGCDETGTPGMQPFPSSPRAIGA
jgi:membrane protein DedA with SNARE-associated domain